MHSMAFPLVIRSSFAAAFPEAHAQRKYHIWTCQILESLREQPSSKEGAAPRKLPTGLYIVGENGSVSHER